MNSKDRRIIEAEAKRYEEQARKLQRQAESNLRYANYLKGQVQ